MDFQSKPKRPPTSPPRSQLSHLGALVGRVGSGIGKYQSSIFAQLQRVVVSVVPQSSFHRAEVHGRVDDVVIVLDRHSKHTSDHAALQQKQPTLCCPLTG